MVFGIDRLYKKIRRFVYIYRIKHNGKKIAISYYSYVINSFFEGMNRIAAGAKLINCSCGCFTYIGNDSDLSYTKIGRFCSISRNVIVCRGNHPLHYITTHPSFYYDTSKQIGCTIHKGAPLYDNIYRYPENENKYQVIIGNDVWIGSHVLILGGVVVGDGSVIAAGSVVTKDVEPYSIVGGNPARLIRKRFSSDVVEKLLEMKWWEKPIEEIMANYTDYQDIDVFFKKNES